MKKEVYTINKKYYFDPINHKGAPYSLDGVKWLNCGELIEALTKSVLGFQAIKDANTPFDKGSDIPELNASVKSGKATLTSTVLGDNFNTIVNEYFNRVHSTLWIYGVIVDDTITLYRMNKIEFRQFLEVFGSYCKDRKVIRFKQTSGIMLRWLDSRT